MLETKVQFTTYALIFNRLAAYLHLFEKALICIDKEIIYEGKIKIDDQSHKLIIQSVIDEAGTAQFYATVDKQPPVELFHNLDTHLWEQLKVGETELAQVCGEVIEAYYA